MNHLYNNDLIIVINNNDNNHNNKVKLSFRSENVKYVHLTNIIIMPNMGVRKHIDSEKVNKEK
jgi:hypothetical protein